MGRGGVPICKAGNLAVFVLRGEVRCGGERGLSVLSALT